MDFVSCYIILMFLVGADGFYVFGPSAPLTAPLGSSLLLPCYIDEPVLVKDLEVQWVKTDSVDIVHFFQGGESHPEYQHPDYRDRAHFYSTEVQCGNFSLRLEHLRAQDEGEYTCRVYIKQDSGDTMVQIKAIERLLVSGSDRLVSVYAGEDVTLDCSVDSHIKPEFIEEVSWKKTDQDGDILVVLYQNNETRPEDSEEQFRGRAQFFKDEILRGNFSLRMSVRTEDKGVYICQVFAGDLSANVTVELESLGFSSLHKVVLGFCAAAASTALLLFCSLIYCRSSNTAVDTIWNLQISLLVSPNICMFFAFLTWGFIEGSLYETIFSCTLYLVRPATLLWASAHLKYLKDEPKPWSRSFLTRELAVLTIVLSSVLFAEGWRKIADIKYLIVGGFWFGLMVIFCLIVSEDGVIVLSLLALYTSSSAFLSLQNKLKREMLERERSGVRRRERRETGQQRAGRHRALDLCNEGMYVMGAVALVLLGSASLTAKLVLKARNGERIIEDLIVILFPSESVFVFYWSVLQMFAYAKSITSRRETRDPESNHGQYLNDYNFFLFLLNVVCLSGLISSGLQQKENLCRV
ncbi:hypothetical protein DNTS_021458 [Danionella cerebrum]|uniref:Ig-like domain-containing protein n=1 Tax=Danionella cerebrum TaxID=2873325 RepID=A0A553R2M1_9TELE|nr:hypothetical protein DNTS_021458 [Danionella translucida]TRY96426.1 hypothetical protein DNTS_021458 [Danionella translucida]